jgi:hypothetical protein
MSKMSKNIAVGIATAGALSALATAYIFKFRPWHLSWGTTDEELTEELPGDPLSDGDIKF